MRISNAIFIAWIVYCILYYNAVPELYDTGGGGVNGLFAPPPSSPPEPPK